MNLQQDTYASNRSSVIVDRTADSVLLTLLKTRSGSAVLDGSSVSTVYVAER